MEEQPERPHQFNLGHLFWTTALVAIGLSVLPIRHYQDVLLAADYLVGGMCCMAVVMLFLSFYWH